MDVQFANGDMVLDELGNPVLVEGKEAKAQDIAMALGTWLEETPYDQSAGMPYLQVFFQGKDPDLSALEFIVNSAVTRREGVINSRCTVTLDRATRVLTITGTAETEDGNVNFATVVETP